MQPGAGSVLTVRRSVHNCGVFCLLSQTLVSTDTLSEPDCGRGSRVITARTDAACLDECKRPIKWVFDAPASVAELRRVHRGTHAEGSKLVNSFECVFLLQHISFVANSAKRMGQFAESVNEWLQTTTGTITLR